MIRRQFLDHLSWHPTLNNDLERLVGSGRPSQILLLQMVFKWDAAEIQKTLSLDSKQFSLHQKAIAERLDKPGAAALIQSGRPFSAFIRHVGALAASAHLMLRSQSGSNGSVQQSWMSYAPLPINTLIADRINGLPNALRAAVMLSSVLGLPVELVSGLTGVSSERLEAVNLQIFGPQATAPKRLVMLPPTLPPPKPAEQPSSVPFSLGQPRVQTPRPRVTRTPRISTPEMKPVPQIALEANDDPVPVLAPDPDLVPEPDPDLVPISESQPEQQPEPESAPLVTQGAESTSVPLDDDSLPVQVEPEVKTPIVSVLQFFRGDQDQWQLAKCQFGFCTPLTSVDFMPEERAFVTALLERTNSRRTNAFMAAQIWFDGNSNDPMFKYFDVKSVERLAEKLVKKLRAIDPNYNQIVRTGGEWVWDPTLMMLNTSRQ